MVIPGRKPLCLIGIESIEVNLAELVEPMHSLSFQRVVDSLLGLDELRLIFFITDSALESTSGWRIHLILKLLGYGWV